jgi:hypothetical protein
LLRVPVSHASPQILTPLYSGVKCHLKIIHF